MLNCIHLTHQPYLYRYVNATGDFKRRARPRARSIHEFLRIRTEELTMKEDDGENVELR